MPDARGLFRLYGSVAIYVVAIGNCYVVDFDLMLRFAAAIGPAQVFKLAIGRVSAFDQARVELLLHYEVRLIDRRCRRSTILLDDCLTTFVMTTAFIRLLTVTAVLMGFSGKAISRVVVSGCYIVRSIISSILLIAVAITIIMQLVAIVVIVIRSVG